MPSIDIPTPTFKYKVVESKKFMKNYHLWASIIVYDLDKFKHHLSRRQKTWAWFSRYTMVEFALRRASTDPDPTESRIPYISKLPAKLCSIHLKAYQQIPEDSNLEVCTIWTYHQWYWICFIIAKKTINYSSCHSTPSPTQHILLTKKLLFLAMNFLISWRWNWSRFWTVFSAR